MIFKFTALIFLSLSGFSQPQSPLCDAIYINKQVELLNNELFSEKFTALYHLALVKKTCPVEVYDSYIKNKSIFFSTLTSVLSSTESIIYSQAEHKEMDRDLSQKHRLIVEVFNPHITGFRQKVFDLTAEENSADNCSEINLLEKSAPLNILQDQSDSNFCTAYAASDLLSYKLGKKVSPLYVALHGYNYMNALFMSTTDLANRGGSHSYSALKFALRNGACVEVGVPLTHSFFNSSDKMTLKELSKEINSIPDSFLLNDRQAAAFYKIQKIFPNLTNQEIKNKIIETTYSLFSSDVFSELIELSCSRSLENFPPLKRVHIDYEAVYPAPKVENIDAALSQHGPVAVTLFTQSIPNHPLDHFRFSMQYSKNPDRHAVTIVGRRYNSDKKVCEYLIKNSMQKASYWQKASGQDLPRGLTVLRRSDLSLMVHIIDYLEEK